MPDTGIHRLAHPFDGHGLGHCHQMDRLMRTAGTDRRAMDPLEHRTNPSGNRVRFCIHSTTTYTAFGTFDMAGAESSSISTDRGDWKQVWIGGYR